MGGLLGAGILHVTTCRCKTLSLRILYLNLAFQVAVKVYLLRHNRTVC